MKYILTILSYLTLTLNCFAAVTTNQTTSSTGVSNIVSKIQANATNYVGSYTNTDQANLVLRSGVTNATGIIYFYGKIGTNIYQYGVIRVIPSLTTNIAGSIYFGVRGTNGIFTYPVIIGDHGDVTVPYLTVQNKLFLFNETIGPFITSGIGTPESNIVANVGSVYTRTDGGAGTTLYVKESGTGNTGWIAK